MEILVLLVITVLISSCSNHEIETKIEESTSFIESESPNKMELKINNAELDQKIKNISAFYSYGRNLDIRVISVKNNGTS